MIFLPFLGATFNRMAGYGVKKWWASKTLVAVYYGIAVFIVTQNYKQAVVVWLGTWLYRMLGWGDYWDGSDKKNKEVAIIDKVVGRFLAPGFWCDFVSMTLRGGIFAAPLFIALSYFAWSYSWIFCNIGFSQGVVYAVMKKYISYARMSEFAEPFMGFLILGGVAVSLYLTP